MTWDLFITLFKRAQVSFMLFFIFQLVIKILSFSQSKDNIKLILIKFLLVFWFQISLWNTDIVQFIFLSDTIKYLNVFVFHGVSSNLSLTFTSFKVHKVNGMLKIIRFVYLTTLDTPVIQALFKRFHSLCLLFTVQNTISKAL